VAKVFPERADQLGNRREKAIPPSCEGIETALPYFFGGRTHLEESAERQLGLQGTDGDFDRYVQMYRDNDGKVDAFGVGGAEFYLWVNGRRYYFREIKQIREAIKISKVGDGNGIKHLLAPLAIQALHEHGYDLRGKKALSTTAVDRYGLARALVDAGCDMTFGDFMFALDIPLPIHSIRTVHIMAVILLPIMTQLPFHWLYSVGAEQEKEPSKEYSRFYEEADVIAGDFLQIWSNLPDDLSGKITPRLEGRSFGTNVIEAMCRCLIDKPDDQITEADFKDIIARVPLTPQVHILN